MEVKNNVFLKGEIYMTTTVKSFILNNLTDKNFEKLVNMLIIDKINFYSLSDSDLLTDYLNTQTPHYLEEGTFEILNEIKKVAPSQGEDYNNELLLDGIEKLNELSMEWMPGSAPINEVPKKTNFKSSYDNEHFEYTSIHQINSPLINNTNDEYEEELFDINKENYIDILKREKDHTALALANFIYEAVYFTNENKPEIDAGELASESSLVKITDDLEYTDGYGVQFLLDTRSRYVTAKQKENYRDRYPSEYAYDFKVTAPEFVEYQTIVDEVQPRLGEYILAPFTFYLNEELDLPKMSDEETYDVYEQLIHVLTLQGFTKEEQTGTIRYANGEYISLYML